MEGGGTEAFPDLGRHCEEDDCFQLDFLPFQCDGCRKVFCLEHRSYREHNCPRSDHKSRLVVVCEACSISVEKKEGEDEEEILKRHRSSGDCDPARRQRARCPVKRCKEVLTISNSNTCKSCRRKVCLKHRFPAEHGCSPASPNAARSGRPRGGSGCRKEKGTAPPSPTPLSSVKAF